MKNVAAGLKGYIETCRQESGDVSYYMDRHPSDFDVGKACLANMGLKPLNLRRINSPRIRRWYELLQTGSVKPKGFYLRARNRNENDVVCLAGNHPVDGEMAHVIKLFSSHEFYVPEMDNYAKRRSKNVKSLTEACKNGAISEGRFCARDLKHLRRAERSLMDLGFRPMLLSSAKEEKLRHWKNLLRSGSIEPTVYKLEVPKHRRGIKCLVGSYLDADDKEHFVIEMFGVWTLELKGTYRAVE